MSRKNQNNEHPTTIFSNFNDLSQADRQALWDNDDLERRIKKFTWCLLILIAILITLFVRITSAGIEDAVNTATSAAAAQERAAWANGTADHVQPTQIVNAAGTLATATNAPRRSITLQDGSLGVSKPRTIINVLRPAAPVVRQAASVRHSIRGDNFRGEISIPLDTSADILASVDAATNAATERYAQKLLILDNKNIRSHNLEIFRVQSSLTKALGWLSLPLVVVAALCGVYAFKAVSQERQARLKTELGVIEGVKHD